jgi:hypothetical protein
LLFKIIKFIFLQMATAPVLVPTLVPGGGSGGIGGGLTTIYRARLANGLQTHVIPVPGRLCGHTAPNSHFFRPVSPHGHIYMEIDPVYARLGPPPGYGTRGSDDSTASSEGGSCGDAHQPDISDDDTMLHQLQQLQQLRLTGVDAATAAASRESSAAASYSARLAEERPLIRNNTLRRSAPLGTGGDASAPGALHGQWDHAGGGGRAGGSVRIVRSPLRRHCDINGAARHHFETPITIALGGGGSGRTNGGEPWFGGVNTDNNQRRLPSSRRPGASNHQQHLHFASVQQGYTP